MFLVIIPANVLAEASSDEIFQRVRFDQHLDTQLPLGTKFRDENGNTIRLHDYFKQGRPAILVLGYYQCPMLCTQVSNALTASLKTITLDVGRDFDVVMLSIDPGETPELARAKKSAYLASYGRPATVAGWHFLTGEENAIQDICEAAGFHYMQDSLSKQYAHASGIIVVTPEGKISRYYFGIDFPTRDLRLSLVEASKNGIGTLADKLLLLCYHYNPATGKYGFAIINAIRAAGVATVFALAAFIIRALRRERRVARLQIGKAGPL